MVSFDVKSVFPHVPIAKTTYIILDFVYNRKEISNILTKDEMKKLLASCFKTYIYH